MNIYLFINYKMDIITIALIEKHIGIPFDVVLFLNEFVKYDKLTNNKINNAIKLWFDDNKQCIEYYGHVSQWNVTKVTNMDTLFFGRKTFNEDISRWDVSNVTTMCGMFYDAITFNSNISIWNVSNVTDMSYMFFNAESFNSNISKWNVSNVIDMSYMFRNSKIFNSDISEWNVSNITDTSYMFFKYSSFQQ